MIGEIFQAIRDEIAGSTGAELRMVAEVVQFTILIAIVWVVAIGWGKRRGFVANMLVERKSRLHQRLDAASHAEQDLAHARQIASLKVRTANADARRTRADAKREAEQLEARAKADADAEAARITQRAETALATELAEMNLEIREELVDIVAQATRSIMNEKMTVAEQRKLIEDTIIANVAKARGDDAVAAAPAQTAGTEAASLT